MQEINKSYENIEVTANFLLGDDLPAGHIPTLAAQIGEAGKRGCAAKGCIYISPLKGSQNTKELLRQFRAIKTKEPYPDISLSYPEVMIKNTAMPEPIYIDGSQGEGGGQILRTSLALAALLRQPVKIDNIRANRSQPGLKTQHLAGVLALARITDAEVQGAEKHSTRLDFSPAHHKRRQVPLRDCNSRRCQHAVRRGSAGPAFCTPAFGSYHNRRHPCAVQPPISLPG